ncbi:MAG: DUF3499 domain-containing protein [Actinomycetota bacterium]|nr:DUF3499 domain-containing protein [Actinomycetota bacterium]
MNLCTKPSCARPGAVVLAYDYAARRALLEDPDHGELSPHVYVLCTHCAERLRPPRGWELEDLRANPPLFADPPEVVVAGTPAGFDEGDSEPLRRQLFFGYSA